MSSYSWKKHTQCKADEQFHFANNKWDITKKNNNKKEKKKEEERGEKKERRKKERKNKNKTQKYEQSLENSQNKL